MNKIKETPREPDCLISLPVKPCDQNKVDESFRASGLGSIDQVFGTDWNQQEKPMSI